MRRSKELMLLAALLAVAVAGVLWYVIDRRARNRASPPAPASRQLPLPDPAPLATLKGAAPTPYVDLTRHDAQTIDFSNGKPEVKNTAADQAALEAGLKEIDAATANVTFESPSKKAEPSPAPPEKK